MTLDVVDFAINDVALFYNTDPEQVEQWPFPRYARREEYMFVKREIKRQLNG